MVTLPGKFFLKKSVPILFTKLVGGLNYMFKKLFVLAIEIMSDGCFWVA